MSTAEAAKALGCSPAAIRKRIADGELAATNVSGSWRVSVPADLLGQGTEPPTAIGMTGDEWLTQRVANLPALLTVDETADLTGFTPRQVRNMMSRSDLPSIHVGRWVRVPTAALVEMLHSRRNGSAA